MVAVNHLYPVMFSFVTSAWASFIKAPAITSQHMWINAPAWGRERIWCSERRQPTEMHYLKSRLAISPLLFTQRNGHIHCIHLNPSGARGVPQGEKRMKRKLDIAIIWGRNVIFLNLRITAREKWGKHFSFCSDPAHERRTMEGRYGWLSLYPQSGPLHPEHSEPLCG